MKKIQILLVLLLSSASLLAGPIGEQRAREIAEQFFAQNATRATNSELRLEWAGDVIGETSATGSMLNTSLMYIYSRGQHDGFVVIAGDSNIAPIIAYSFDTAIDTSNMAEATRAILDAWCRQVAGARQAAKPVSVNTSDITTRASNELLYQTALWNQGEPYNWEAPVYDGYSSVTGCVATAMSIICYYNEWPERGVGTTPEYTYEDVNGVNRTVAANNLGRTYDYSNMLMDYNYGYTTSQGNAVAALMKDMGTSVKMMYHYYSSGAYDTDVIRAFTSYFGYSKSAEFAYRSSYPIDEWNELLRQNLDVYGPMYYSGMSSSGGHAFVVDGYSGDYFHFNFGWGGAANGYFLCPDIEYYAYQMALLGLTPDRDGTSTYKDDLMLSALYRGNEQVFYGIRSFATSYSVGQSFECYLGGFENYGLTTFNGQIKFVLCDKDGVWKEELYTEEFEIAPYNFDYCKSVVEATITKPLEVGDRLRIYYKGAYSDDWQWMRSRNLSTVDQELLVMASPEDIAKGLEFTYYKEENYLRIFSPNTAHVELYDGDTDSYIGYTDLTARRAVGYENTAGYKTLVWKISLGSEPYILTIKL